MELADNLEAAAKQYDSAEGNLEKSHALARFSDLALDNSEQIVEALRLAEVALRQVYGPKELGGSYEQVVDRLNARASEWEEALSTYRAALARSGDM